MGFCSHSTVGKISKDRKIESWEVTRLPQKGFSILSSPTKLSLNLVIQIVTVQARIYTVIFLVRFFMINVLIKKKSFLLVETERWNNRSKLCFGLRWRKTKYFFVFCSGKNLLVFVLLFYVIRVRYTKCQIIRQFTRLHLRGMELANILSEWLRNPGKRTSGSQNRKHFPGGTCPRTPPRILSPRLGNPSVFILIRSAPTVHTFNTAQSRNPDGHRAYSQYRISPPFCF